MKTFKQNQTGAAIVVCLMLLTIATLVGLNAMSSTVLEEKMAGNIRNKHLSFQSAEAGLRDGELTAIPINPDTATWNGTNGLFPRSKPGDADYPVWENGSTVWVDGDDTQLPTLPQFIIENFGVMPRDQSCAFDPEGHNRQYL